jgi:hypothetical protein
MTRNIPTTSHTILIDHNSSPSPYSTSMSASTSQSSPSNLFSYSRFILEHTKAQMEAARIVSPDSENNHNNSYGSYRPEVNDARNGMNATRV